MLIHGKNVGFVIEKGTPVSFKLKSLRKFFLWVLKRRVEAGELKTPYFKEMCESFLINNIDSFIDYSIKMVTQVFIEVLEKNPMFITSKNFKIHIKIIFDWSVYIARYDNTKSNLGDAYFEVYLTKVTVEGLFYGIKFDEFVYHEFIHHLRKCFGKPFSQKLMKLMKKHEAKDIQKPAYTGNVLLINYIADSLFEEGLAEFAARYNKKLKIYFKSKSFDELREILDSACKVFEFDDPSKFSSRLLAILHLKSIANISGSIILATIVLNALFKNNKKFYAWLKLRGFLWLGKREYNAIEIRKFYGIKNFDLYFMYDDKDANAIVEQKINILIKMEFRQILIEYEEACRNLGVKPFFTRELYKSYITKCWENYQRYMASRNAQT